MHVKACKDAAIILQHHACGSWGSLNELRHPALSAEKVTSEVLMTSVHLAMNSATQMHCQSCQSGLTKWPWTPAGPFLKMHAHS